MESKIIAQKFGGTSVSTPERRQMIVEHVRHELDLGNKVAMVVSAMGRKGDPYASETLLDLLRTQGGEIDPQHYSFLFVTGEIIAAGVVAHTLHNAGLQAVPLTGGMAGIQTEDFPMSAAVTKLDPKPLRDYVEAGQIPVVCGGQGLTRTHGNFSVLGRGSSDTSGVLVGMMLNAGRVDIYTDVEYMQLTDPLLIPEAPKRPQLSFDMAYEIARFGAKVIHPGAVRLGKEHKLPIRVRSTFSKDPGTLICEQEDAWPLCGLPLKSPVQVAELKQDVLEDKSWQTLEQHVGLLRLVDLDSGRIILCAPTGDTAGVVDQELRENGIGPVTWERGFSLLSLIGSPAALPEMDTKAARILGGHSGRLRYHEVTANRSTFVVPEAQGRSALDEIYAGLRAYLEPAA